MYGGQEPRRGCELVVLRLQMLQVLPQETADGVKYWESNSTAVTEISRRLLQETADGEILRIKILGCHRNFKKVLLPASKTGAMEAPNRNWLSSQTRSYCCQAISLVSKLVTNNCHETSPGCPQKPLLLSSCCQNRTVPTERAAPMCAAASRAKVTEILDHDGRHGIRPQGRNINVTAPAPASNKR